MSSKCRLYEPLSTQVPRLGRLPVLKWETGHSLEVRTLRMEARL